MVRETLQDKVVLIQEAETQEESFARFTNALTHYGYTNNCYTLMNDHASLNQKAYHGLATSYPQDWMDHYNSNNYQDVDMVWERLLARPTPFFWSDLMDQAQKSNTFDKDRLDASLKVIREGEDAGVADGVGISFVNTLGEIAGFGLSKEYAEKKKSYEELAEVYLLATFFHDRFLSFYPKPIIPRITDREREVLLWASEGKTDQEIGMILCISVPTVRFHWKNIFQKLDVGTRIYAVTKALRLQLITPQMIKLPYQL